MSGKWTHRYAHLIWPGLVVLIMMMGLSIAAIAITVSSGDPSFAVEEDYYEKSLAWDQTAAQRARNEELGWSFEVERVGGGTASFSLHDASGALIEGADVSYEAFANARAARKFTGRAAGVDGVYTAGHAMPTAGQWVWRLEADVEGEVFTQAVRADVGRGG